MNEVPDDGTRFSQIYLRRGDPTADSVRMRKRISALVNHFGANLVDLASAVRREQGVDVPYYVGGYHWDKFLLEAELRDVLDLVSTAAGVLSVPHSRKHKEWVTLVGRVFAEENVPYRVNQYGGVRYAIDDEFDVNRHTTISVLAGERYRAALYNFEEAHKALSAVPPRGKDAVRAVFSAAEGLFRLMFSSAHRLGADEITRYLQPIVAARFNGDETAQHAAKKLIRGFREWVDGAHFYRHEPGQPEPKEPPMEISIIFLSSGSAWLRWLAEIDRGMQQSAPSNYHGGE